MFFAYGRGEKNIDSKTFYFGNKLETISSVIGKNSLTHTLSTTGKSLNRFLDWIDKDHSLNSIIYELRIWKQENAKLSA